MEKPIIEVKNLGKKYDIAHMKGGYVALRDVIATIMRRPFSFLAHKAKRAVGLEKKEEFWALRGVDFSVGRGEVIGVIGANGAGKSTLLKVLSQITPPTEGEVILRGRVGSLLEVGTGFHPELTGRENIFLNGAILGMKKREIAKKFDEIVAFAGVEKFLDTPVKHYSSGMYVRLAFSVAAHMEPDILLVDEVLAVGDAEFQKKCLGKMDEITKKEGRTILFVSHNMGAIKDLCKNVMLLENGRVKAIGPVSKVMDLYYSGIMESADMTQRGRRARVSGKAVIERSVILARDGQPATSFALGDEMIISVDVRAQESLPKAAYEVLIRDENGHAVIFLPSGLRFGKEFNLTSGLSTLSCKIPSLPLAYGTYTVDLMIADSGNLYHDYVENAVGFSISQSDPHGTGTTYKQSSGQGCIHLEAEFSRNN